MPESSLSSSELDPRRRRALTRAWRRGLREMDVLMGGFADAHLPALSDADLADFEELLEVQDRVALSWLTGEATPPPQYQTPLFARLKAFHTHARPIHS